MAKKGGNRPNSGRSQKYIEPSVQLSLKVPKSKKKEVKQVVDEFLDEFTLKSLNDMIALGYYFKYVAEKKQWIFFSPDGEIIMGFDKKPIKKEMAAKHYSINKKGEITAVFL